MQLGQLGHLGYFTHVGSDVRPASAYRQTIELAIAAETMGPLPAFTSACGGRPARRPRWMRRLPGESG